MNFRIYSLLIIVALFSQCRSKRTDKNPPPPPPPVAVAEPTIVLDTIQVIANKPVMPKIYRGSATRTNDILHTRLEVDFDWTNSRLNGKALITVKPYFYPVSTLFLNARGMEIKNVEVFERPAADPKAKQPAQAKSVLGARIPGTSFVYENDSLKINLGRRFNAGENYVVVIQYVAKPNELKSKGGSSAITEDKGLYFVNPAGLNIFKMPQIWTQGETQASSVWFPTIDSPNERMTQEILMTVDDQFTTLSNGNLVSSQKNADGKRVDHWVLDQPHAPYLAMMAVGRFKKVTDNGFKGKEISYYVEPEYEAFAKDIFGETPEMISFFSEKLGVDFPWSKYAQIVVRDYVSGAMENTSATLHGDFVAYQTRREMADGNRAVMVISHELFHQWFGDLVTCESWSNLPLNESFATYGEYLWEEHKRGRTEADHHLWESRQGYISAGKEAHLIRFEYEDKEDMFDAISYNKGGQVLHMLRKAVGDSAFFASLKLYLEKNQFKSVEIHNLRLAFEEVTGRDMNWFFDQWFLNKGRPKLKVSYTQNENSLVELTVEQTQDLKELPLYTLPLDVDFYVNGKAERKHLLINKTKETFTLSASGKLQLLNFDAERQLLADIDFNKTREQLIFQYNNTPLYADRYEALTRLAPSITQPEVLAVFQHAAVSDTSSHLRIYALGRLEKVSVDNAPDLKTALLNAFDRANHNLAKAAALKALNKRFGVDSDVKDLNEQALKHVSYAVCSEALDMMAKHSPQQAMIRAKQFEKDYGKSIMFTVANLYANHGSDKEIQFFHDAARWVTGFDLMSYCALYSKTAQRCQESSSAITAAMDLEYISNGANKYVRFSAIKAIRDILTSYENRAKALNSKLDALRLDNKPVEELEKQLFETNETLTILAKIYQRVQPS